MPAVCIVTAAEKRQQAQTELDAFWNARRAQVPKQRWDMDVAAGHYKILAPEDWAADPESVRRRQWTASGRSATTDVTRGNKIDLLPYVECRRVSVRRAAANQLGSVSDTRFFMECPTSAAWYSRIANISGRLNSSTRTWVTVLNECTTTALLQR